MSPRSGVRISSRSARIGRWRRVGQRRLGDERATVEGDADTDALVAGVGGHVPAETIETLLVDAPPIDGVALSGMPAESPGMGGQKQGRFTIYALGGDRTGEVFAEQ